MLFAGVKELLGGLSRAFFGARLLPRTFLLEAKGMKNAFYFEKVLDSTGRLVVPKAIREQYGIAVGDTLRFVAVDDGILLLPVKAADKQ